MIETHNIVLCDPVPWTGAQDETRGRRSGNSGRKFRKERGDWVFRLGILYRPYGGHCYVQDIFMSCAGLYLHGRHCYVQDIFMSCAD